MDENTYRKLSILKDLVLLIGGCFAFFITNRKEVNNIVRQQQHAQSLEFKKTILTEKLRVYTKACQTAGLIANMADTGNSRLDSAINEFDRIYRGEIGLFEDSLVVQAAIRFRLACRDYKENRRTAELTTLLIRAADNFTEACKASNKKGWNELF